MRFNEAQQEAVDFYQGPCLTLAGPGSGKTAVITHRTKNLIEKYVKICKESCAKLRKNLKKIYEKCLK